MFCFELTFADNINYVCFCLSLHSHGLMHVNCLSSKRCQFVRNQAEYTVVLWGKHLVLQCWCEKVTVSRTLGDAHGQFALALDYRTAVPDLTGSFVAF